MTEESKPASGGQALSGCLLLLFLSFLLGQCMFSGGDDPKPAQPVPAPSAPSTSSTDAGDQPSKPIGINMLEQAIFDAFPSSPPKTKEERRTRSNASDFVAATINAAGHLCAQPIEVQRAAVGQYGIGCRRHQSGGHAIYLIDVRTGNVDEI